MNEQRTPDELSQNELICEKLLGWKRRSEGSSLLDNYWRRPTGADQLNTPTFTTWAEAGLILDGLVNRGSFPKIQVTVFQEIPWVVEMVAQDIRHVGESGPLAIRGAALEYIRSLP
jgi:hypothetical protein